MERVLLQEFTIQIEIIGEAIKFSKDTQKEKGTLKESPYNLCPIRSNQRRCPDEIVVEIKHQHPFFILYRIRRVKTYEVSKWSIS